MTSSARLPSPARAGPSRTRHRRLITHDGAKGGAARRHAPILGSNGDDVRTASSSSSSCPPDVRANLSARYADAVRRAADDPFVPYENANGIINLAECSTTLTNRGPSTPARGGGWDDPPEGTPEELTRATIAELGALFGQGGVEATAVTGPGIGPGFVRLRLAQFQDDPTSWASEAELWESMVETYGVLLRPGAIGDDIGDESATSDDVQMYGSNEPGTFLACVAGRSEEALLTGMDRLRTQLLQRKFLHGRW